MEKPTSGISSVHRAEHPAHGKLTPLATALSFAVPPLLLVACLVLAPDCANAAERDESETVDTSSPRATLESFLDACSEIHRLIKTDEQFDRTAPDRAELLERILDCLDTSDSEDFGPVERVVEAAVCLKEILDRQALPPWEEIPDEEAIEAAGGPEKLSDWQVPGIPITIARVEEEGPHQGEYLFAPETVDGALKYFKRIEFKPYRTDGPEVSRGFHRRYRSVVAMEYEKIKAADTSSPRATLKSFIDGCNEIHELIRSAKHFDRYAPEHAVVAARVMDCVDTSELPAFARERRAAEVAICLKEILDREELPRWEEIPDFEDIEAAGGFEKLSHWRLPGTRITITRVEEGAHRHEYLFSPGTVDRAVEYFKQIESKPYRVGDDGPKVSEGLYRWYMSSPGHPALAAVVERLPDSMRFGRTCGLANWKWPGILVTVLIAITLMATAYRLQASLTKPWREKGLFRYWLSLLFPITAMLTPLLFQYVAERYLTMRGMPLYIVNFAATTTALLAAVIVVFATTTRIAESIIASPRINPQGLNAQLIRIVSKLTSLAAVTGVFLAGGQYLGIPVTTLLASAGIGGLAIAFGAQDSLRTLFGTLMLMGDKPFRVGERIIFDKYDGVVEDIGLRSTKVRLLTGHQVTVPNGHLAQTDIENVGRRPHIRKIADIHIPLDTSRERIEQALAIIRTALKDHEGMDPEFPPRVFFTDFKPTAFNIRVIYWYTPALYWDFLAFGERVNLEIFRAFDEQGIQFSLPFRVTNTSLDSEAAPVEVKMVDVGQAQ
ncbi:MAG: mechanosensitive ion channel family protein [Candidatus Nealsonbacteria bacterium]|nr:mechanosensitive ion channel family protein [Candidatus Nealsonbacteria bacterium]